MPKVGRMRVGFCELDEHLRVGGLEAACRGLEAALRRAGHEVVSLGGGSSDEELRACGVVHFHGLWSPEHARVARRLRALGLPHVTSPHGMLEPWAWRAKRWKKWPYFHLIERRKMARGRAVLATAAQEAGRLERFFPRSIIRTLSLGSDLSRAPDFAVARGELGWAEEERVILYLSRIHPKKGLKELLLALAELDPDRVRAEKVRLVIVGDGPADYVATCRALAARLEDRLTLEWLAGVWSDRKWRYLQGADLFALPTYSENFGIVVLESCEVGTPVLTTVETPWAPVAEAGFGWIVKPGVSATRAALDDFLGTPRATPEDRRRCAEWVKENYGWDTIVGGYIDLYREARR